MARTGYSGSWFGARPGPPIGWICTAGETSAKRREEPTIQTFLPYQEFDRTAAVLDTKRLGKQRVEVLQVMQVLLRLRWDPAKAIVEPFQPRGWTKHPAVLMWRGHERALGAYQDAVCAQWAQQGFRDTCETKTRRLLAAANLDADWSWPPWLGDPELHRSHQSNLIRKDPLYYGPLFPGVPADLPYVWPVQPPDTDSA